MGSTPATIRSIPKRKKANKSVYQKVIREVTLEDNILVRDLANQMCERVPIVIKELVKLGVMVNVNGVVDAETAECIIDVLGHKVKRVSDADVEKVLHSLSADDKEDELQIRPPIVTVMGHVDHGKTSLLDAFRKSDVVSGEAGGITQHIGAYNVKVNDNQSITFIDTPGHEAFTAMRLRGAQATDIVVLVVAADDGIMEQTVEAINHAKAAQVPIIIAINKIDKDTADSLRIKNELLSHGIVLEEFSGDIMVAEVSAKTRQGIDQLMETILLQAEMLDLKAKYNRSALGVVIESKIEKGLGNVTSLLIKRGTLKISDMVLAGNTYGKIRLMTNDQGANVNKATPSMIVRVSGLSGCCQAGEIFYVLQNEKQIKSIIEYREQKAKLSTQAKPKRDIKNLLSGIDKNVQGINFIIKADVNGSLEAISAMINKLSAENEDNNNIKLNIIHSGIGIISESDIRLAQAAMATVIGFNVNAERAATKLASNESVSVKYYSIIYEIMDEIKIMMSGLLDPEISEKYLGRAVVKQVFDISKIGRIAGSLVTDGMLMRGAKIRITRDNKVIYEGNLKTLKRFKDDVKEVKENFECGIGFDHFDDIAEGDTIEVFEIVSTPTKIT